MLQPKVETLTTCRLKWELGAVLAQAGSQAALQLSLLHGLVGKRSGCHDNFSSHFRLEGTFPKAPLHLCILGDLSCLGEGGGEPLPQGISPSLPMVEMGRGTALPWQHLL